MPVSIVNGLLSSREKSKECLKEFVEKRLTSRYTIKERNQKERYTIEKEKKPREISTFK